MPITGPTGISIWDEDDPMSVHGASANQEASIRNRINAKFANTTDRDTAYTGMSNSTKAGVRCFIVDRAGWCFFDGFQWQWEPQMRMLCDEFRPSPAAASSVSPLDVILTGPFQLPGSTGSRKIWISATAYVTNATGFTGNAVPRILVETTSQIAQQQAWLESGNAIDLRISWTGNVAAGSTIFPKLRCLVASGSPCNFYGGSLQVFDMGPVS